MKNFVKVLCPHCDRLIGLEVFRVVDGKIVEIWNSRETGGHWQPSQTF